MIAEIISHNKEIEAIKRKLVSTELVVENLLAKERMLMKQLDDANIEKRMIEDNFDRAVENVKYLEKELEAWTLKNEELKREIERLNKEVTERNKKLEFMKQTILDKDMEIDKVGREKEVIATKMVNNCVSLAEFEEQKHKTAVLEKRIESLGGEKIFLEGEIIRLKEEIESMTFDKTSMVNKMDEKQMQFHKDSRHYREVNYATTNKMKELTLENKFLKEKLGMLENERKNLDNDYAEAINKIQYEKNKNESIRQQLFDTENDRIAVNKEADRLRLFIEELKKQNANLTETSRKFKREVELMNESYRDLEVKFADSQFKVKDQTNLISTLETRVEEKSIIATISEATGKQTEERYVDLNQSYSQMRATFEKMSRELNQENGALKELSENMQRESAEYRSKFSALNSELEAMRTKNEYLEKQLGTSKVSEGKKDEEIIDLYGRIEENEKLVKKNLELSAQNNDYRLAYNDLVNKLKEAEMTILEINSEFQKCQETSKSNFYEAKGAKDDVVDLTVQLKKEMQENEERALVNEKLKKDLDSAHDEMTKVKLMLENETVEKDTIVKELERIDLKRKMEVTKYSDVTSNLASSKNQEYDTKTALKNLFSIGNVLNMKVQSFNRSKKENKLFQGADHLLLTFKELTAQPMSSFNIQEGMNVFERWLKLLRDEFEVIT